MCSPTHRSRGQDVATSGACTSGRARSLRSNRRGSLESRQCMWWAPPSLRPCPHQPHRPGPHRHRFRRLRCWTRKPPESTGRRRRRRLDPRTTHALTLLPPRSLEHLHRTPPSGYQVRGSRSAPQDDQWARWRESCAPSGFAHVLASVLPGPVEFDVRAAHTKARRPSGRHLRRNSGEGIQ